MPRILIAGVCHQIGAQVVLAALKRCYEVTAIVSSRQEAKCARMGFAQRLNELELHNLSLVIIPLITYNDGLNVLLKSTTFEAIIFASIPFNSNNFALEQIGLLQNILSLVQRSAPSVKRFVLTSSLSAILPMEGGPFPKPVYPGNGYTELDWNPITWEKATTGDLHSRIYGAATFVEKTAWEFVKTVQPRFELVTLCAPSLVFGDTAQHIDSPNNLCASTQYLRRFMSQLPDTIPQQTSFHWVDVADLAEAHIRALEQPRAANRRIIVCAGSFIHDQLVAIFKTINDPTAEEESVEFDEISMHHIPLVATALSRVILEMRYVSLKESVQKAVDGIRRVEGGRGG